MANRRSVHGNIVEESVIVDVRVHVCANRGRHTCECPFGRARNEHGETVISRRKRSLAPEGETRFAMRVFGMSSGSGDRGKIQSVS